ncbi:hypothetical protein HAV38_15375 [Glaciimonas immobilis]|nr:hypothetical protein HAV38_15375 [Glaciimonas immobilis]
MDAKANTLIGCTPGFKQFIATVLLSGFFAGLALTGVQKIQVTPIIAQAEVYEAAAAQAALATSALLDRVHANVPANMPAEAQDHQHADAHPHDAQEWEPANGTERTLYTIMANVTMAVGFAFLLGAAVLLRGDAGINGWREGLLWGFAGYIVVFAAPSLGLPPEVPGTHAAPLMERQIWWIATALLTAMALALFIFGRHWSLKLLAVVLLLAPHLVGAPEAQVPGGAAPPELVRAFIYATAIANGVFWLALGGVFGFFSKKFFTEHDISHQKHRI